jgi:hypothetical protein
MLRLPALTWAHHEDCSQGDVCPLLFPTSPLAHHLLLLHNKVHVVALTVMVWQDWRGTHGLI